MQNHFIETQKEHKHIIHTYIYIYVICIFCFGSHIWIYRYASRFALQPRQRCVLKHVFFLGDQTGAWYPNMSLGISIDSEQSDNRTISKTVRFCLQNQTGADSHGRGDSNPPALRPNAVAVLVSVQWQSCTLPVTLYVLPRWLKGDRPGPWPKQHSDKRNHTAIEFRPCNSQFCNDNFT